MRGKIAELVEKAPEAELLAKLQTSVKDWTNSPYSDLREARKRLADIAQKASKWSSVKANGIDYFKEADRGDVQRLIKLCSEAGLFIVPKGELQNWMNVGFSKGKQWNRKALQELRDGKCPQELGEFVEALVKFLMTDTNVPLA